MRRRLADKKKIARVQNDTRSVDEVLRSPPEHKGKLHIFVPVQHGGAFFYLRRGLLVNLKHVSKITRTDCVLDDGESLPVARGVYKALNEAFIACYVIARTERGE